MKKICLALFLALCFLTVFAACSLESENGESSANIASLDETSVVTMLESEVSSDGNITSSESEPSSEIESSEEEIVSEPEKPKYDDLFGMMEDCGKEIVAYGDLALDEYAETLDELEQVLKSSSRNMAVVGYSLDNNKAFCYNTQKRIFCASAIKAPYSLYCCYQMEKGFADLNTKMTYESEHYEIGTGDLQYMPVGSVFDMKTIIGKAMSISDNVGYLMSVDYFGREGYNEWITELGAETLKISPTVWSLRTNAKDLALAWREIAKYFESDSEIARFLYASCTNTENNYATQSLTNVEYSHKQGNQRSGNWHSYTDASIVWKGENPYIIVILTDAPGPSSYDADIFAEIMAIVHNKLF